MVQESFTDVGFARRAAVAVAALFWVIFWTGISAAQPASQADWERAAAAAKREGRLAVAGPTGDTHRMALAGEFEKSHPEIRVEYTGVLLRDMVPRMLREWQAGAHLWDIFIGVSVASVASLKSMGAFDPLQPVVIRPDVLEDGKWLGGFQDGFMDADGRFYYAFDGTVGRTVYVNRDVVPAGEFQSLKELLDPKWAGKIVWDDPRQPGGGRMAGLTLSLAYGEEFLLRLLREQKIAYTTDRRQATEWVVRGRHPISIGLAVDELVIFQEKGVGRNVEPLEAVPLDTISPGFGSVALMSRGPHPNAAKLYVNWLLSQEGQRAWTRITKRNSRRLDVAPGDPGRAAKPSGKYVQTMKEAMFPKADRVMKLARETIP